MFKIETLVNTIFKDYDHNNDGQIQYKNAAEKIAGNPKTDESLRERIDIIAKGNNIYKEDIVTVSHRKLFTVADADKNGFVDKTELTGFLSKFDKNKNDQLDLRNLSEWMLNESKEKAEYKSFTALYPEKTIS